MPRFEFLAEAGSTNDELRDAASGADAAAWPHGSVIVTDNQTHGRGRLGRTWLAPTGKTLAISVLLRPELPGGEPFPPEGYGWIPLIAGRRHDRGGAPRGRRRGIRGAGRAATTTTPAASRSS